MIGLFLVAIGMVASRDTALASNSIETPDSAGCVGLHTSIALDALGKPVVSYTECAGPLKLLHCGDTTCSSGNSIQSVDTSTGEKYDTSIAIDSTGRPVVAYFDNGSLDLKVLRCGNANCTSGNTITTPDSAGDVGRQPSLILDSMNRPVISYKYDSVPALKVLRCGDATCSSGNSYATPDSGVNLGDYSSIVLDAAGKPVVSYFDASNGYLKLLHCGNVTCTSGNSVQTVDTNGIVGLRTSLKLDSAGRPVIAYHDYTNTALKLMFCGDANCTVGNTTLSVAGQDAGSVSLELRLSEVPIVSEEDDGTLKIVACSSLQCATGYTVERPDYFSGQNGSHSDLTLDAGGNPVVSYSQTYDNFFNLVGDLKVLHCSDPACTGVQSVGGIASLTRPIDGTGGGSSRAPALAAVLGGTAFALLFAALVARRRRRHASIDD